MTVKEKLTKDLYAAGHDADEIRQILEGVDAAYADKRGTRGRTKIPWRRNILAFGKDKYNRLKKFTQQQVIDSDDDLEF